MTVALITALGISVPAIIGAVIALIKVFRHTSDNTAHAQRNSGPPQA